MMKFYTKILAGLLFAVFAQFSSAATVNADGKTWFSLVDTMGHSFNEVNALCPAGACSGSLGGLDITGYTFASNSDVKSLFEWYTPGVVAPSPFTDPVGFLDYAVNDLRGTGYATDFFGGPLYAPGDSLYSPSHLDRLKLGFTIDSLANYTSLATLAIGAGLIDVTEAKKLVFLALDFSDPVLGAYLYKDVSAVPIPAALFMFAPALLGFMGLRRRAKNTAA